MDHLVSASKAMPEFRKVFFEASKRKAVDVGSRRRTHDVEYRRDTPQYLFDPAVGQAGGDKAGDLAIRSAIEPMQKFERIRVQIPFPIIGAVKAIQPSF